MLPQARLCSANRFARSVAWEEAALRDPSVSDGVEVSRVGDGGYEFWFK